NRERIDCFAVPILPVLWHAHDLKVQVRNVLRRIACRADEADRVALRQWHPWRERLVIVIEVRVVVHDARLGVSRVHGVPAGTVPTHPQYAAVVGGEHGRATRRENVDRMMSSRSVARLVERIDELVGMDPGDWK